jgi:hypothetical protein
MERGTTDGGQHEHGLEHKWWNRKYDCQEYQEQPTCQEQATALVSDDTTPVLIPLNEKSHESELSSLHKRGPH